MSAEGSDAFTPLRTAAPGRALVLLRHGRTAWNATGRAQGHADVVLDEVGHAQAMRAAAFLAEAAPAALWSSDLARAARTCGYLESATGLSATYDTRLREFDVGIRQGLTLAEFEERHPLTYASWVAQDPAASVAGEESRADLARRLVPALRGCLEALAPGELGVVVSHGACLKVGLAGLLGWPSGMERDLQGLDNCGWALVREVAAGDRLRLVGYNQAAFA